MKEMFTKEIESIARLTDIGVEEMSELVQALAKNPVNFQEVLHDIVHRAYEIGVTDGYEGQCPWTAQYTTVADPIFVKDENEG